MPAFLDDRRIDTDRPTLAGVLAAGAEMAEADGRIIVEVRLDGKDVDGSTLQSPPDDDLGESEVRLVSADPHEVAGQALADAGTQLDTTRARQAEVASLIQQGKVAEGMSRLGECLADWQTAQHVVSSVGRLVGVHGPAPTIDALAALLTDLRNALSGQDWATVADLLAYDLDEQATAWIAMLDDLRRTVRDAG